MENKQRSSAVGVLKDEHVQLYEQVLARVRADLMKQALDMLEREKVQPRVALNSEGSEGSRVVNEGVTWWQFGETPGSVQDGPSAESLLEEDLKRRGRLSAVDEGFGDQEVEKKPLVVSALPSLSDLFEDFGGDGSRDAYAGCYLQAFEVERKPEIYQKLDNWPDLEDFLSMPQDAYLPFEELIKLRCLVSGDRVHVFQGVLDDGSTGDCSLVAVIAQLPAHVLPNWAKLLVARYPLERSTCVKPVGVNTMLGGNPPAGRLKMTLLKGGAGAAACSHCKKVIVAAKVEAHPGTCPARPGLSSSVQREVALKGPAAGAPKVDERNRRLELVGDVMHQLDVKVVIATVCADEARMTIDAGRYLSAPAQRRYLEMIYPGLLEATRSDHAWGTAFEVRYVGNFRKNYLRWMIADYCASAGGGVKSGDAFEMAKTCSSLLVQVFADLGLNV